MLEIKVRLFRNNKKVRVQTFNMDFKLLGETILVKTKKGDIVNRVVIDSDYFKIDSYLRVDQDDITSPIRTHFFEEDGVLSIETGIKIER